MIKVEEKVLSLAYHGNEPLVGLQMDICRIDDSYACAKIYVQCATKTAVVLSNSTELLFIVLVDPSSVNYNRNTTCWDQG